MSLPSSQDGATNDAANDILESLVVDCHVEVEDRTWPGMNKQGGIARVKAIDREGRTVDVQYVVDRRKEKTISLEYIVLAPEYDTHRQETTLRDRSKRTERCTWCLSFREDCGSCDSVHTKFLFNYSTLQRRYDAQRSNRDKSKKNCNNKQDNPIEEAAYDSLSEDEEQESLEDIKKKKDALFKRVKTRAEEDEAYLREREEEAEAERVRAEEERKQNREKQSSTVDHSIATDGADLEDSDEDLSRVTKRRFVGRIREKYRRKERVSETTGDGATNKIPPTNNNPQRRTRKKQRMNDRSTSVLELVGSPPATDSSKRTSTAEKENLSPPKDHEVGTPSTRSGSDSQDCIAEDCGDDEEENADNNTSSFLTMDIGENEVEDSSDEQEHGGMDSQDVMEHQGGPLLADTHDDDDDEQHEIADDTVRGPNGLVLKDFIMPEGRDVADHLPEDINDRAADVAYMDLPNFFDTEASRLESELIPDAKLSVARLQRKVNQRISNNGDGLHELTAACDSMIQEITTNLIRDGLDQCMSAVKQLTDEKRYKREKKNLSREQRKIMRKEMELKILARDARFDALQRDIDELVDQVQYAKRSLVVSDDLFQGSQDESSDSYGDDEMLGSSDSDMEERHSASLENSPHVPDEFHHNLPPYDRHEHALTKRKSSQRAITKRDKKRSTDRRDNQGRRGPLREMKTMDSPLRTSRSSNLRKRQRDVTESRTDDTISRQLSRPATRGRRHGLGTRARKVVASRRLHRKKGATQSKTSVSAFEDRLLEIVHAKADSSSGDDSVDTAKEQTDASSRRRFKKREDRTAPRVPYKTNGNQARRKSNSSLQTRTQIAAASSRRQYRVRNDNQELSEQVGQRGGTECEDANGDRIRYSSTGTRQLFSRLGNDKRIPPDSTAGRGQQDDSTVMHGAEDLGDILDSVERLRPSDDRAAFVRKLKSMSQLLTAATGASTHETASRGFATVLKLFHKHCSTTLQEALTQEGAAHVSFVAVLTETLKMIEKRLHAKLNSDDGLAFKIFAEDDSKAFISAVVLQLVDALYSVFHPAAWANPFQSAGTNKTDVAILNDLIPLRDALSRVVDLPQSVCSCIASDMSTQEWRVASNGEKRAFVTSADQRAWTGLLEEGQRMEESKVSRWSQFKIGLPKCEIEAAWKILAFLADAEYPSKASSDLPVRFASRLLLRGVLNTKTISNSGSNSGEALGPSPLLLDACQIEMKHLCSLLRSSAFGALPKNDDKFEDIVKRALSLHHEAYVANQQLFLPKCGDASTKRADLKTIKRMWHTFLLSPSELTSSGSPVVGDFLNQPLVLPSCSFLRQVMALVFIWTRSVPLQTARINRFKAAIRGIVGELIKAAELAEKNTKDSTRCGEPDLFALAFSADRSANLGWQGTYLREAGAYVDLIALIALKQSFVSNGREYSKSTGSARVAETAKEVWKKMADSAMVCRQLRILSCSSSNAVDSVYQGDDYRLYGAGKAMTCATHAFLGVQPWRDDSEIPQLADGWMGNGTADGESLVFLFSSLVACLDCCCDKKSPNQQVTTSLFTCIATCLSLVYRQLVSKEPNDIVEHLIAFGKVSLTMISRTIKKCFSTFARDCVFGVEASICVRSLLTSLQGAAVLTAHIKLAHASNTTNESSGEGSSQPDAIEDLWGDLRDEDIAGMDIIAENGTTEGRHGDENDLFRLLCDALIHSKPSSMFVVENQQHPTTDRHDLHLSPQGKLLVDKHKHYICDCLAALAATLDDKSSRSLFSFMEQLHTMPSDDDMPYYDELALLMSLSLCNMVKVNPKTAAAVVATKDLILPSLMDQMLDSAVLCKFPTQNEPLIISMGGRGSEEALNRLVDETKGGDSMLGEEVWQFCEDFASALRNKEGARQGDADVDLGEKLSAELAFQGEVFGKLHFVSMEKECLKRIVILTFIMRQRTWDFERICYHFVAKSSFEVLKLSEQISDATEGEQNAGDTKYGYAMLLALYSTYAEMHIGLLCWMLHQERVRSAMKPLVAYISNDYFPSLLQNNEEAANKALHEMINTSQSGSRGVSQAEIDSRTKHRLKRHPNLKVTMLRESLCRRSRELFLLDSHNDSRIFQSLISIGSGRVADSSSLRRTICRGLSTFSPTASRSDPLGSNWSAALDCFMTMQCPNDTATQEQLWLLRHRIVQDHLIPRLRLWQSNQDAQAKTGIIRFVTALIEAESSGTIFSVGDGTNGDVSLASLKEIVRGLSFSLRVPFETPSVDNEFLCAIIMCAKALADSLVRLDGVVPADYPTVAEWSQSLALADTTASTNALDSDDDEEVLTALYVWHSLLWFEKVSELLVDTDTNRHQELWRAMAEKDRWLLLPQENEATLKDLTTRLFASKERAPKAINVYAKRKLNEGARGRTNTESSAIEWHPTPALLRAAKAFMAQLIPLC